MKLLIVAATDAEVAIYKHYLEGNRDAIAHSVDMLTTGVGMTATAYALTRHLSSHSYDLVIQAGVCGSYDSRIPLGALVQVVSEQYGDMGTEDNGNYIDIMDMGLVNGAEPPYRNGKLQPIEAVVTGLQEVSGLTVNMVSGQESTIARRAATYGCHVESMEGAAFHYVCLMEGVRFAQVRAISNYVIPRDKSQWKMKEAIVNLNNWLEEYTESNVLVK